MLTIGVFDGVHRGHQALLAHVAAHARTHDLTSVAITFDPHPIMLISPERAPKELTSVERRIELLLENGIDHVRVLNFTPEMSRFTPEEFLRNVVVSQCSAQHVIVGENFRFGAKAAGDFAYLEDYGSLHGFTAANQTLTGDAEVFSSTRVRQTLLEGDVETAALVLGRPFAVEGIVVHGDHRGRELGFPTANIVVGERSATPADGVYAGWLVPPDGQHLPAAISVGTNPTFEGVVNRRVEAHVLDREDLDLYGAHIEIEFIRHVREMKAFATVGELLTAMAKDIADTRDILGVT